MQRIQAELTAHCLSPAGRPAIRLRLPAGRGAVAGQPWLACPPDLVAETRRALYPVRLAGQEFEAEVEHLESWPIGPVLDLLGPIGPGLRPPRGTRRWLLATLRRDLGRLLPLVDDGLARGAAVAAWGDATSLRLPAAVEILPGLRDGLDWADYVALDADTDSLARWTSEVGDSITGRLRPPGEVLLDLPMLCGFGGCHACSVSMGGDWRLACKDGPVFPLAEVLR